MQIQVNTDHNIQGHEPLRAEVQAVVEGTQSKFSGQITHVEVHLSDENGSKQGPNDKRCVMEARLAGRHPTAVTHDADSVHEAVHGAAEKLQRAIRTTLGILHDQRS